jgi:hypothetical protein
VRSLGTARAWRTPEGADLPRWARPKGLHSSRFDQPWSGCRARPHNSTPFAAAQVLDRARPTFTFLSHTKLGQDGAPYHLGIYGMGAQYELNRALVLRAWATASMGAFSIMGAVLGDAEGAAWGFLAGTLVGNVFALWYAGRLTPSLPRVDAREGST